MKKYKYNWWRILILVMTFPVSIFIGIKFKNKSLNSCFQYNRDNNIQEFLDDLKKKNMQLEIPIDLIENFDIKSDKGNISALKLMHENSDKWVIGLHGWTENKFLALRLVMHIYNMGYNVITFDAFAHGKSYGEKTDFGYSTIPLVDEIIKYLKTDYKPQEIGLIGNSMGASAAILYGETGAYASGLKWIIADSGFSNLNNQFNSSMEGMFKINWIFLNMFIPHGFKKITGLDPRKYDLLKYINYDIPTMFIHSKTDTFVPCWMSQVMFEKHGNSNDVLWTPTGPDHFNVIADLNQEYKEKTKKFINKKLAK
ncbi:alpha/beta hydrolase [Williamsoniiplasma luminosum]|uniref:Alpha/beta hydrolase n=1 Tax=Williamsoniiplasma luminosum TaxID=214888 RepID=A0A2S0NK72_9MOLU|nr:alpha/beta hydrolase [Williamsoniiplasma luminosum]AVP49420.1 MAG: alpha/beta hydrolase [Williamsoniiplasma luminosum]